MRAAKRDANEREMVEAWRALGALWIPMAPGAGFDGLLVSPRRGVMFVEVKDVRADHNRFYLTDSERKLCAALHELGQEYHIVRNMTEALALVGAE